MEVSNNQSQNSMDTLKEKLQQQFPEIVHIVAYDDMEDFDIEIREGTVGPPFVKAVNAYLKKFILDCGDPETSYNFSIQRGTELIDILRYN
ncbi:hypothetical protein [Pedobacter nyackensis]|uniref:Uncharacterized protein n=1 Tax=Pedobacter nyackensis TaxID=475255 RepID=A0A1W2F5Y3_9SPHI|nr:hypothetical protein [Pedobacter nyackensis]SMD16916.1 hypothetical protein SAMN04488101_12116 [Pedobacter nyackensis]